MPIKWGRKCSPDKQNVFYITYFKILNIFPNFCFQIKCYTLRFSDASGFFLFSILLKHKKIIMYCMENVNINFSTFLNFVYKNIVCLSSNKIFFERLWSIVWLVLVILTLKVVEFFRSVAPWLITWKLFFFFKLEEKTGLFFICYNFFPEYTLYSHIYHNLLKPVWDLKDGVKQREPRTLLSLLAVGNKTVSCLKHFKK